MKKEEEFAVKIYKHLSKMFDESEETDDFIDLKEVMENDEATELIHAISNTVPNMFYGQITGNKTDSLGFNHIANRLAFQFSKTVKEDEQ